MDSQSKMPKEDLNNNELSSQNRLLLSSSSLSSSVSILQGDNDNEANKDKDEKGNDKLRESIGNSLKKKRRNDQGRNGRWQRGEHELFIQGCLDYGNNWKKVKEIVKTRTSAQIRSHAQKYLIKLAKKHHDFIEANKANRKAIKIRGRIDYEDIHADISSYTELNNLDNSDKEEIEKRILLIFQNESNSMNHKANSIKEKNSNNKSQGKTTWNTNDTSNNNKASLSSSSSLSSIQNQTIINNSNKNNYYLLFSGAEKQKNFEQNEIPLRNTNMLNQSFSYNNNSSNNTSIMPNYPFGTQQSPYYYHYNNNIFNDYHSSMNYLYSNVTANNVNNNTNNSFNYNEIHDNTRLLHCLNLMANPTTTATTISNSQAMKENSNYHSYYTQLLQNLYNYSPSVSYYDFTLNNNK